MKYDIEPDLQYCPRCGDEYRAEIRMCASCDVELIPGERLIALREEEQSKGTRSMNIGPDDELVAVRKGAVVQIKQLQAYLEKHGVPSVISAEEGSNCGKGCCGTEVFLEVRETDLRDVMALLQQEYLESTGVMDHDVSTAGSVYDAGAAEVTCPACGHTFAGGAAECPDCGLCFA